MENMENQKNEISKIGDKELEEVINKISKVEIPASNKITTKDKLKKIMSNDSQHNMELIIALSVISVVMVGFIGYSIISYKLFDNKLPQSANIANSNNQSSASDSSTPAEVLKLQEVTSDKENNPVVPSPSGKNDPFQQLMDISNEITVSTDNSNSSTENDFIEWLLGRPDDVSSKKDQIKSLYQSKTNKKWDDLMQAFKNAGITFYTTSNPTNNSATSDTNNTNSTDNPTTEKTDSSNTTSTSATNTTMQNSSATSSTATTKVYSIDPKISDVFEKNSGEYSLSTFKVLATANNTVLLSQIKVNKIFYDVKCNLYGEFDIGGRIIYATSGDQLLEGYFVRGINYSKKSVTIVDSKGHTHTIYIDETTSYNLK